MTRWPLTAQVHGIQRGVCETSYKFLLIYGFMVTYWCRINYTIYDLPNRAGQVTYWVALIIGTSASFNPSVVLPSFICWYWIWCVGVAGQLHGPKMEQSQLALHDEMAIDSASSWASTGRLQNFIQVPPCLYNYLLATDSPHDSSLLNHVKVVIYKICPLSYHSDR